MIRSTAHLKRFSLTATDGLIGSVADFLFDDDSWVIRYVVVDTGKWLPGRKVLITPLSIQGVEWGEQRMLLSISRDQVRNSPAYDTHRPVSRQHEIDYFNYYNYPYYWGHAGLWGSAAYPRLSTSGYERQAHPEAASERARAVARGDGHLRSADEVAGYTIRATDGELGHADDFLISDLSWAIRYVVVNTSAWWFGRKVLVAPEWIDDIQWAERKVAVSLSRKALKEAPAYDRAEHVDRQWEAAYYSHLGAPGYWVEPEDARTHRPHEQHLSE